MAAQDTAAAVYPFTAFNFLAEITVDSIAPRLCEAAFSECDGLEMTMDVKTIREGGNNGVQVRLAGAVNYGTLTLKRGMTSSFHVWEWFEASHRDPSLRAHAEVALLAADRSVNARFVMEGCLPLKVKAPPMNAKDGVIAIEELQVAYESLSMRGPDA